MHEYPYSSYMWVPVQVYYRYYANVYEIYKIPEYENKIHEDQYM